MNKKGTSLVELIAVIVIMGVIASIAVPTTIAVINRQRKNSCVSSMNSVYHTAQNMLSTMETNAYEDCVFKIGDNFGYTSYSILVSTGNLQANGQTLDGSDIYFLFNTYAFAVIVSDTTPTTDTMPTTNSDTTTVGGVNIYWDYATNKFKAA